MTAKPFTISMADWRTAGTERFGADEMNWRFRCPSCGHVARPLDWKNAGAPQTAVAFSCVGRWTSIPKSKKAPFTAVDGVCNYAGGGLFGLNPVHVVDGDKIHNIFDFADMPITSKIS